MPDHVINEMVFTGITLQQRETMLSKLLNEKGYVDFSILLPVPINYWMGDVGTHHKEAFKNTALDWQTDNWGTKWNAYECLPTERSNDGFRVVFQTAWRPPYGWLCAVFNTFNLPFKHNFMSEEVKIAYCATYNPIELKNFGEPWIEEKADLETNKRLKNLLFGV